LHTLSWLGEYLEVKDTDRATVCYGSKTVPGDPTFISQLNLLIVDLAHPVLMWRIRAWAGAMRFCVHRDRHGKLLHFNKIQPKTIPCPQLSAVLDLSLRLPLKPTHSMTI